MDFISGEVLLINKPLHWTSFQVVNKLKFAINRSLKESVKNIDPDESLSKNSPSQKIKCKIGHAGTLDPLATGLLILCTGKKTKEIEQYQAQTKEYTGRFFIGATTPCFDLEKQPDTFFSIEHITNEMIFATTQKFTGEIMQSPPAHSAVMIEGKRAYELARKGEVVLMKEKPVTIYQFEITSIDMPYISFRVECSKGTYIRSLANDFGKELGSGAYLAELCRTRIGDFLLKDAFTIDDALKTIENTGVLTL